MREIVFQTSENLSERPMSAEVIRLEMHRHVREVAALAPSERRKTALTFAARVLGLSYQRARAYFYDEVRVVPAHEADQIRAYVQAAEKLIQARDAYDALRQQYLETAHPSLVRFAPGPLAGDEVPASAEAARRKISR